MKIYDPTGKIMRWRLQLSRSFIDQDGIIKYRTPCPDFDAIRNRTSAADEDEIPTFGDATVLAVHTCRAVQGTNIKADDSTTTAKNDPDTGLDDPTDAEDFELAAIDLYHAVDMDANIDPDNRN